MTLLLTLARESAIHQSSDYRLNINGVPCETANGTKQIPVSAATWTARVSFTGIASDNQGYDTLVWVSDEGVCLEPMTDPESFVRKLAQRGTRELRRARTDRRLTLVIAVAAQGKCRLFLISNFEEPGKRPLAKPRDSLALFELRLSSPLLLVNGAGEALPKWLRRRLKHIFQRSADSKTLRDQMAAANRCAASQPTYQGIISEGCWTFSLLASGASQGENRGLVPGIPSQVIPGFDFGEWLKNNAPPGLTRPFTLVQTTSSGHPASAGKPPKDPAAIGEAREIELSCPATPMMTISDRPGFEFLRLAIGGLNRTVVIRKNAWVEADLNPVTFEIDPTREYEVGPAVLKWQHITNIPSIGGAQPGSWDYTFDVHVGGGTYVLTILQNSTAIRSANCKTHPHVVGPTEELLIAAPSGGLVLTASRDVLRATETMKARLLLRDCSD